MKMSHKKAELAEERQEHEKSMILRRNIVGGECCVHYLTLQRQ
jgi:hypothetical protein